jgi:hypothetical protein
MNQVFKAYLHWYAVTKAVFGTTEVFGGIARETIPLGLDADEHPYLRVFRI